MKKTLEEFLENENFMNKETCYNEASLQHELGYFLRKEKEIKVYFEKSISEYWKKDGNGASLWKGKYDNQGSSNKNHRENKTIKKNIDLVLEYSHEKIAIELKRPKKGDPPNVEFWSFIQDIKFIEEMLYKDNSDISKGYFIVVFDKSKKTLYSGGQGSSTYTIYKLFRQLINNKYSVELKGEIQYPFKDGGEKQHPIILENIYKETWKLQGDQNIVLDNELGYLLIEIPKNNQI